LGLFRYDTLCGPLDVGMNVDTLSQRMCYTMLM